MTNHLLPVTKCGHCPQCFCIWTPTRRTITGWSMGGVTRSRSPAYKDWVSRLCTSLLASPLLFSLSSSSSPFTRCWVTSSFISSSLVFLLYNTQTIPWHPSKLVSTLSPISFWSDVPADIFFGLNAVRVLSIISLILVFASSIFVMVKDIEAVNSYEAAKQGGNATQVDLISCDYIEYAAFSSLCHCVLIP